MIRITSLFIPDTTSSPLYSSTPLFVVLFFLVSVTCMLTILQKQVILLLMYKKVNSSLTIRHNVCVIHLTLSHFIDILSSQIILRRVSTVQQDVLRETPHSHNFYYIVTIVLL